MILKFVVDEDIANYRKTSMFVGFPHCTFKCDKENGCELCQNSKLAHDPNIEISASALVLRYINNPLTHAVVIGGLEPFDDIEQLMDFIRKLRSETNDDIVIYTGYREGEIAQKFAAQFEELVKLGNIIIKYGRFRPNEEPHMDPVLGVKLVNEEQYARRLD